MDAVLVTDLGAPGSSPAADEIFSTVNGVLLHAAFHYQLLVFLIWLKYCRNGRKIANYPAITLSCLRFEGTQLCRFHRFSMGYNF